MDFVPLIAVLVITQTSVIARPTEPPIKISKSEKKRDIPEMIFKFPKMITDGFTVTINGTLDTDHETLIAVVPSSNQEQACKIVHSYKDQYIEVSPAPSSEESRLEYPVTDTPGVKSTFSLILRARILKDNQMFKLSFNRNGVGESSPIACPISSFEDFSHIVFKEGVEKVTSLLFEFEPYEQIYSNTSYPDESDENETNN